MVYNSNTSKIHQSDLSLDTKWRVNTYAITNYPNKTRVCGKCSKASNVFSICPSNSIFPIEWNMTLFLQIWLEKGAASNKIVLTHTKVLSAW